jgi:hypothetical protein
VRQKRDVTVLPDSGVLMSFNGLMSTDFYCECVSVERKCEMPGINMAGGNGDTIVSTMSGIYVLSCALTMSLRVTQRMKIGACSIRFLIHQALHLHLPLLFQIRIPFYLCLLVTVTGIKI